MIKPIGAVSAAVKPVKQVKQVTNIDKAAAKERLINLIKDFEECAKLQPENKILHEHINRLKESLKKYQ